MHRPRPTSITSAAPITMEIMVIEITYFELPSGVSPAMRQTRMKRAGPRPANPKRFSDTSGGLLREQPFRPPHQHEEKQCKTDTVLHRAGDISGRQALDDAEEQASEDRAFQAV